MIYRTNPDIQLIIITVILLSSGLIMLSSASAIYALKIKNDSMFFFKKQCFHIVVGVLAMWLMTQIDYQKLKKCVLPLLITCGILLVMILIPQLGVGIKEGEAIRWFRFGPISFQPSEFMKLILIIFLAHILSIKQDNRPDLKHWLLPFVIVVIPIVVCIFLEPDWGTALFVLGLACCIIFLGRVKILQLTATVIPIIVFVCYCLTKSEYHLTRIIIYLNQLADPRDAGYQILQSLRSLGSGGLLGVGIGESKMKLLHLPALHTDFIFAIIGEELGFLGCMAVLIMFLFFAWRGVKIAMNTADKFGFLVASGITIMIFFQAMCNIGIVCGLIPTKGLPLPFFSYGGSSLIVTLIATGILLNISMHSDRLPKTSVSGNEEYFINA